MSLIDQTRVELTAAFRWAARLNLHEATANHFSAAVSSDGQSFLINPRGRHFSQMRASELELIDTADRESDPIERNVDPICIDYIARSHL